LLQFGVLTENRIKIIFRKITSLIESGDTQSAKPQWQIVAASAHAMEPAHH
jgi:hypothetical protein